MLSRVFNFHKRTVSTLILGLIIVSSLVVGCGGKTVEVATPQDHPAHPGAPQTVFGIPPDTLKEEMAMTEEGVAAHHRAASLSEEGEEALAMMLDAYFVIGDQLASDTMEDVNAQAHAMLEALHTLEHEAPAELWHSYEAHTEAIHDHGHEVGDLSDIKAARVAYGSLSDVLNHFVAAVSVPASYESPVYSYVCGMASDVPQGGIWLQVGEDVRNPYFGSAMLKCHSAKMQMPVSSTDMSGHEDMKSHEHKQEKGGHEHHHHDMHKTQEHEEMEHHEDESEDPHGHDAHEHNY